MHSYRLRFLCGPQEALHIEHEELVMAASAAEALATRCCWPIQSDAAQSCAWAKHPGTSLYDVIAWEARLETTHTPGSH